jgi:hypothetical protein
MKRSIARLLIATVAALSLLTTFGGTAFAQSGHFVGTPTCTDIGTQVQRQGRRPWRHDLHDHGFGAGHRQRHLHQPGRQCCAGSELHHHGDRNQWALRHAKERSGSVHGDVDCTDCTGRLVSESEVDRDRH